MLQMAVPEWEVVQTEGEEARVRWAGGARFVSSTVPPLLPPPASHRVPSPAELPDARRVILRVYSHPLAR